MTTGPKPERNDNQTRYSIFCPAGYHGDPYLMKVVDDLAGRCGQFVETGTEAGSTVGYTARMYPHMTCHTVETDKGTFELASKNLANHPNIWLANGHSLDFLKSIIAVNSGNGLFWLDAHSHGWGCQVGEEVGIVLERWTGGYILIDDFQVPGLPKFGFDWYKSYKLDLETVLKDVPVELRGRINSIHFPNYEPKFSWRGWVLIQFGDAPLYEVPEYVWTFEDKGGIV